VAELRDGGAVGQELDAVYDEMVTGTGQVRSHWQKLMSRLSPLDPAVLEDKRDEAVQLLRQHGATYSVYGDPSFGGAGGAERPWPLDILPLVISGEEWRAIEAGVIQRARLLNALLGDVYGKQHLIASGALAPALINANPRFLHPCWNALPEGATHLHFSAFDLCRGPDGVWRVLSDRTQAPSGAGYALENRSVVGRVLPDCIAADPVLPLAPFFAAFRDSLHRLLPGGPPGRVVLLTPGPYNETYFEHVFLARHLGVTLVEGNDLTVRDRHVFLKTLSGLDRVGVILRRLDDDFCDPLEMRASSALGVAGLTEAVRAGSVVIANALFGDEMTRAERESLAARIALRPMEFVGQERALLSTAPAWNGERLEPRPVVLRVFVAAIDGGFAVMPGGLTRTAGNNIPVVSMQRGGGSKDSWVLAAPGEAEALRPAAGGSNVAPWPQQNFRRPFGGELPSRVADGLFWVGRYAERADGVVRLLRILLVGVTDAVQPWRFRDAEPILNFAAWLELAPVIEHPNSFQPITMVQTALLDPEYSAGVIANVGRLVNAARRVRDRLPADCWRIFMALDRHVQQPVGRAPPVRLLLRLEELITLGAALAGAINESMTRDAGWRFVEMGRRLERALHMVMMIRSLGSSPVLGGGQPVEERRLIASILALTDPRGGTAASSPDQPDSGLDLATLLRAVLLNEADPRSLVFQLAAIADHLAALPRPSESLTSNRGLVDSAIHLTNTARNAVAECIIAGAPPRGRGASADSGNPLRAAFTRLDVLIPQISELLTQAYFTHAVIRSA
jgi:uncharacterized circularly permuted ATP-grasp superfamily protein/uncharacterized alpha-E superfamily protein